MDFHRKFDLLHLHIDEHYSSRDGVVKHRLALIRQPPTVCTRRCKVIQSNQINDFSPTSSTNKLSCLQSLIKTISTYILNLKINLGACEVDIEFSTGIALNILWTYT